MIREKERGEQGKKKRGGKKSCNLPIMPITFWRWREEKI